MASGISTLFGIMEEVKALMKEETTALNTFSSRNSVNTETSQERIKRLKQHKLRSFSELVDQEYLNESRKVLTNMYTCISQRSSNFFITKFMLQGLISFFIQYFFIRTIS